MAKFVTNYSERRLSHLRVSSKRCFITNKMKHISFITDSIFSMLSMVRVAKNLNGDQFMVRIALTIMA